MKATELRDRLDEIINEHGDADVFLADQLESRWRHPVEDADFEHDRSAVLLSPADY